MTNHIRFDDGAGYEQYMGKWSQLAGNQFLDWLAPPSSQRWLDVGCGNGAFTELVMQRCEPASVCGIDPSEAQLAFARARIASPVAEFRQADAMALPFADRSFDVAIMPLVIFFVPEPERGIDEMARVVRPGGTVAAYAWDMETGGFPYSALQQEMRALELSVPSAPHPEASRTDVLRDLWSGARLDSIETREITVQRTFASFDEYWTTIFMAPSVGRTLKTMSASDAARLKGRMRERLPEDGSGRIVYSARANAITGRTTS